MSRQQRGPSLASCTQPYLPHKHLAQPIPRPAPRWKHDDSPVSSRADEGLSGVDSHEELGAARHKITTLRSTLAQLTTHLARLTDRLAAAESSLASLQLTHDRTTAQHAEERSALQALCTVWEGRWREERRAREEAEAMVEKQVGERQVRREALNGDERRRETALVFLSDSSTTQPSRTRRFSHSSSSSSALSKRQSRRRTTSQVTSVTRRKRTKNRAVIAQLAHDLQLAKQDVARVQQARVEEVARLAADVQVRRSELSQLYSSFDLILTLRPPSLAPTGVSMASPAPPEPVSPVRPPSSVLDLPGVRAAAAHSRARGFLAQRAQRDKDGEEVPEDVAETLRLEEEVRNLEAAIARLDAAGQSAEHDAPADSSILPIDGSQLGTEVEHSASRADNCDTIARLEGELDRVRADLVQADHERTALKRLLHEKGEPAREEALLHRVAQLEGERNRLSRLLRASEAESATLQSQLSATHASLDTLAARVHVKLLEQRDKLRSACDEIGRLEGEVQRLAGECEGLKSELERRGRSGSASAARLPRLAPPSPDPRLPRLPPPQPTFDEPALIAQLQGALLAHSQATYDPSSPAVPLPPSVSAIPAGIVASFPLRLSHTSSYLDLPSPTPTSHIAQDARTALAGDAAYAVRPLAGQRLDIGLADALALAGPVGERAAQGVDDGAYPGLTA